MSRIAIDLGFIKIYWYSICIFLGMLIASILIIKESKKKNINQDFLTNLIFYTVIIGIIGARTYYVLFNLEYYLVYPIEIFQMWNGGLAIHGGLIAALIFMAYYCKKNKVKLIDITDISVVGLVIAQAIGRWGNFFNKEAFGMVTTINSLKQMHLPKFIIDGMYIDNKYRQPTFLYESIMNVICFLILIVVRKRYKNLKKGQLTGIYLVWYGLVRIIVEYFRSDSLMLGNLKVAQLVSFIFIIFGIYFLARKNTELYNKTESF